LPPGSQAQEIALEKEKGNKKELASADWELTSEEIFSSLQPERGSSLFLGRYSLAEVKAVLAKNNFFREARHRQLWPLEFSLDSTEFPLQRLQIFWERNDPDRLIVDLKIREAGFPATVRRQLDPVLEKGRFLHLEWLTLQNPRLEFSEKRPALPGQNRPGLGLGKKVVDIFIYLGRLLQSDGLLAFPAYFHNSLLFSRYFRFVNPEKEGEVTAIRSNLAAVPFKQLAWIVFLNCLRLDGRTYEWQAEEQALPLSSGLKDYFASKKYKETVRSASQKHRVEVDWENFHRYVISFSGAVLRSPFAVPE